MLAPAGSLRKRSIAHIGRPPMRRERPNAREEPNFFGQSNVGTTWEHVRPNTGQNGGVGPTSEQDESATWRFRPCLQNLHSRFKSGRRLHFPEQIRRSRYSCRAQRACDCSRMFSIWAIAATGEPLNDGTDCTCGCGGTVGWKSGGPPPVDAAAAIRHRRLSKLPSGKRSCPTTRTSECSERTIGRNPGTSREGCGARGAAETCRAHTARLGRSWEHDSRCARRSASCLRPQQAHLRGSLRPAALGDTHRSRQ
jgi:hypothetical protein